MLHADNRQFTSLEALNAFPFEWDLEVTGSERDATGAIRRTEGADVLIATAEFSAATLQLGSSPVGYSTFAIPLVAENRMVWRDFEIDTSSIAVFPDNRELYCTCAGATSILTLSIARSSIEAYCRRTLLSPALLYGEGQALALDGKARVGLIRKIEILSEFLCRYGNHRQHPELSRRLEDTIIDAIFTERAAISRDSIVLHPHRSQHIVARAIEYIEAHKKTVFSIADVCDYVCCHRRVLELAFREHLNTSPKRFANERRLQGVRADLLLAQPKAAAVKSIASDWGYWHMGQFAQDYYESFGELPSHTLARPPR